MRKLLLFSGIAVAAWYLFKKVLRPADQPEDLAGETRPHIAIK